MELLSTHPIKTADLGFHGNLFGGTLLAWMDASAVGYAMRLCGEPRMLTLSLDNCRFKQTVKEGELLSLHGWPCDLGRTSIRITVEARVMNLATREEGTVMCACIRFVCVNSQGKSMPISGAARERIAAMIHGPNCTAAAAREEGEVWNGWCI